MGFLLDALWRMTTQTHHHIKWFCYDKLNRIERGYGPDGLYPSERSHADKERLPQEHREPALAAMAQVAEEFGLKPCAWKAKHGCHACVCSDAEGQE